MTKPLRKIVLIEDDPHTNTLLTENLRLKGFEVISTYTGEDGLAAIRKHRPDLIMLDILLPGMDGWDVCRTLRVPGSEFQKIPITIITVVSKDEARDKGVGPITFISKPFNINTVVQDIENVIGETGPAQGA